MYQAKNDLPEKTRADVIAILNGRLAGSDASSGSPAGVTRDVIGDRVTD